MSPEQALVFERASGLPASRVSLGIAAMLMTVLLIWAAWLSVAQFRRWQDSQVTLFDLTWGLIRTSVLLMAAGFLLQ